MKILGLDFETQGLDIENSNPTEIGAVLLDVTSVLVDQTCTAPTEVERLSKLLWEPGYPPNDPEIIEVTGITDKMLKESGEPPGFIFKYKLFPLMEQADYIFAHNAQFDKGILHATAKRNALTVPEKPWVCTKDDVVYPGRSRCRKLSHLGLDLGLKMDNRELHRAINDVDLMIEVLFTLNLAEVIAHYNAPKIKVRAVVPAPWLDKGVGVKAARERSYQWDTENKFWARIIKASDFQKEKTEAPFSVVQVDMDAAN